MTISTTDRRSRRHQQTVDEILDVALEVMAAEGVAGLSLAEVARRVGMQPPSLYQYFPSKLGLYDALFARGMRDCLDYVTAHVTGEDPLDRLAARARAYVRWGIEHPVLYQLLFWRPVPGFEPSEEAMAASVAILDGAREDLAAAVAAGRLRAGADSDEALGLATAISQGLVTQQLANEPGAAYDEGRFSRLTDRSIELFESYYATGKDT